MTVSLELLFDAATERAIRDEWNALEAGGHSSLAAHRAPSNRPHLTLAEGADEAEVDEIDWQRLTVPFAITIGAPLLFGAGDRRVLARSVVPGAPLLDLHSGIHDRLSRSDPLSRPGEWMPHVTLARRLRLDSLADALGLTGGALVGQAVAVRSWNTETRVTRVHLGEATVRSE